MSHLRILGQGLALGLCLLGINSLSAGTTGSVIVIHPDGTGLGHWNAARYRFVGPDGDLNWDKLERLAAFRPHQTNFIATVSRGGATTYAYGRKVHSDSYGMDLDQPIKSLSGKDETIMEEAMAAGIRVGTVNTGQIAEPGTGVFLARSLNYKDVVRIAPQILGSGADLIFAGGEIYMLPEGEVGRHGEPGVRKDGRNLLKEASDRGYTVIYTREELLNLDPMVKKVIGVFAATDTYNVDTEENMAESGMPTYDPEAPTFAEMVRVALKVLGSDPEKQFMLFAEEEGTDNFSNKLNARGMLDAIGRADEAIGVARGFLEKDASRQTLLMVAADSDAAHPGVWGLRSWKEPPTLPLTSGSGAYLSGINGQGGEPFYSPPDALGKRHPFGIAWGTKEDLPGSVVIKAHGFRSDLIGSKVDNTDVYRILYQVLFGKMPAEEQGN